MRSFIAIVAVLAITGNVDAATKTTKSAKASKGVRVAAVKKQSAKSAAAGEEAAAGLGVETRETAKEAQVAPATPAKKLWSGGLDMESYARIEAVNQNKVNTDSAGTTDYAAKVSYKITDTLTMQGVSEWSQEWGQGVDSDAVLQDPSLRISKSDLAELGDVKINGQARLYLPVSEVSQDKEQIAQIRFYGTATRDITKSLAASFTLNPRIFLQQNEHYIDAKGEVSDMDRFRLWSFAGLKYTFNDVFAVEQTFGIYQKWRTDSPRKDFLDASSSVYITPVKWLEINAGIRQSDGATDTRQTGMRHLYSADQAEYFLLGSFSI